MVKTSITPWEDIVITVDPPEDVTEQGVVIAQVGEDERKKKPEKGIVVAIGPASTDSKKLLELLAEIQPGDIIFYERYTANKIPDAGEEYNFVRFKYIMGFKKA